MKIINISDIHGDFETFAKALKIIKTSDAEVLAINGDLAGNVFEGKEKDSFINISKTFYNFLSQIYNHTNGQIKTIHDTAKFLISNRVKAPDELKKFAEDYLGFEKKAEERMSRQYQEFKQRFDDLEQKVILIPGNWDGKCINDFLEQENIHNISGKEINGIKFVGYGGSKEHPVNLPLDLTVHYNKDEAYSHLCKHEDAEIALSHNVPRGFEFNGRPPGEYSLLAYLYRNAPSLILTGHTHNPFVSKEKKTGTIVANPGNLGRYENQNFGTFLEIDIDNNFFVKPISLYKINKNSIDEYKFEELISQ